MKSYQAFLLATILWDWKSTITKKLKTHKHMEHKQFAIKQPTDHLRNQREDWKIPRHKMKTKHNNLKPMRHSKRSSKREVYSNTS